MTATERHKLLHLSSSQKEADTKVILYAHKILKEGSPKVAIHSLSGDTDILLLTLTQLYEYKERIYIINSHGQYKKHKTKQYYFIEDEIIKSLRWLAWLV